MIFRADDDFREGRGCCGDCSEGEKGHEGDEALEGGCHPWLDLMVELMVVGSVFPVSFGSSFPDSVFLRFW